MELFLLAHFTHQAWYFCKKKRQGFSATIRKTLCEVHQDFPIVTIRMKKRIWNLKVYPKLYKFCFL